MHINQSLLPLLVLCATFPCWTAVLGAGIPRPATEAVVSPSYSTNADPQPFSAFNSDSACTIQPGDTFLDALLKSNPRQLPKYALPLSPPSFSGSSSLRRDFASLLHLATLSLDPLSNGTVLLPLVNPRAAFTFPKFGRCSLTTSDPSTPLASPALSKYFEDVFRAIGNTKQTGISLNRFDLFHAHMMVRRSCNGAQFKDVTTLAFVFHSKEYPALDETLFAYPLGFCQTGSNVTYSDTTMRKRNVVWLLSGKVDPKTGALDSSWARLTPQLFQIDSSAKIGVPSVDETLSEAPFYTMDEGRLGKPLGDMVFLPGAPVAVNLRP